jgi:hypothetical protein
MSAIVHKTEGLARNCTAWDLFTVTGGLQCGNCLAHNVPTMATCRDRASDGACPLPPDGDDGRCWIHRLQHNRNA